MANLLQYVALAIVALLTLASAALMHRFFGWIGVALFVGMTVLIAGIVLWLTGSLNGSPDGASSRASKRSKGARNRGERR